MLAKQRETLTFAEEASRCVDAHCRRRITRGRRAALVDVDARRHVFEGFIRAAGDRRLSLQLVALVALDLNFIAEEVVSLVHHNDSVFKFLHIMTLRPLTAWRVGAPEPVALTHDDRIAWKRDDRMDNLK